MAMQLLVWGRRALWEAGGRSVAAIAAVQKMEQLRSLAWDADEDGVLLSDAETDLTLEPLPKGGRGLQPGGSLGMDAAGYVDYLDAAGAALGTGANASARASYTRRWSIEPWQYEPIDTRILSVLVVSTAESQSGAWGRTAVRIITIRTRGTR